MFTTTNFCAENSLLEEFSCIKKTKSKVFLIFSLIVMGVFSILFATLASADLYLNSKVGTIYFIENYIIYITFILQFSICITALNCHLSHAVIHNTTGVARASIGPGGNFSINTSDFFVNTNLGRVRIGTVNPTQNILNFIGDMNG